MGRESRNLTVFTSNRPEFEAERKLITDVRDLGMFDQIEKVILGIKEMNNGYDTDYSDLCRRKQLEIVEKYKESV